MPRSTLSYGRPKLCYSDSDFFQKCRENARNSGFVRSRAVGLLRAKGHPRSTEGRLEWA